MAFEQAINVHKLTLWVADFFLNLGSGDESVIAVWLCFENLIHDMLRHFMLTKMRMNQGFVQHQTKIVRDMKKAVLNDLF